MFTLRRFLSHACLLSLATLAGCSSIPGGSRPLGTQGGFTVRVDGPGLPGAASVVTDIGAFAQRRGFVRQPATPEQERYVLENLALEISRQPTDHRITAYLHGASPAGDGKFSERFYRDFSQEYARRYGGEDRISESAYGNGSGDPGGAVRPVAPWPGE